MRLLNIGDDFGQLDEASVQHDSQLGSGGPFGRAGSQQGLQGLQQHWHRLTHHTHRLQCPCVALVAKHNQPTQSLQCMMSRHAWQGKPAGEAVCGMATSQYREVMGGSKQAGL